MFVLGRNILILCAAVLALSSARAADVCEIGVFKDIAKRAALRKKGLVAPTDSTKPADLARHLEANISKVKETQAAPARKGRASATAVPPAPASRASRISPREKLAEDLTKVSLYRYRGADGGRRASSTRLGSASLEKEVELFAKMNPKDFRAAMKEKIERSWGRLTAVAGDEHLRASDFRGANKGTWQNYRQFLQEHRGAFQSLVRMGDGTDVKFAESLFEKHFGEDLRRYVAGLGKGPELRYDAKATSLENFKNNRLLTYEERATFFQRNGRALASFVDQASDVHVAMTKTLVADAGFPREVFLVVGNHELPGMKGLDGVRRFFPEFQEPFVDTLTRKYARLESELAAAGHEVKIHAPVSRDAGKVAVVQLGGRKVQLSHYVPDAPGTKADADGMDQAFRAANPRYKGLQKAERTELAGNTMSADAHLPFFAAQRLPDGTIHTHVYGPSLTLDGRPGGMAYLVDEKGYTIPITQAKKGGMEILADNGTLRLQFESPETIMARMNDALGPLRADAKSDIGAYPAADPAFKANELEKHVKALDSAGAELRYMRSRAGQERTPEAYQNLLNSLRQLESHAEAIKEWHLRDSNNTVIQARQAKEWEQADELQKEIARVERKLAVLKGTYSPAASRASASTIRAELHDLTDTSEELSRLVRRWHDAPTAAAKEEIAVNIRARNRELLADTFSKGGEATMRLPEAHLTGQPGSLEPYKALGPTIRKLEADFPDTRVLVELDGRVFGPGAAANALATGFTKHFEELARSTKTSAAGKEEAKSALARLRSELAPGRDPGSHGQRILDAFCGGVPKGCPPAAVDGYLRALASSQATVIRRISRESGLPVERFRPRLGENDFAWGGAEARYIDLRTNRVTEEGRRVLEQRSRSPGRCGTSELNCLVTLERGSMPDGHQARYLELLGADLARDYAREATTLSKTDPAARFKAEERAKAVRNGLAAHDPLAVGQRTGARGFTTLDGRALAETPSPFAVVRETEVNGVRQVEVVQNPGTSGSKLVDRATVSLQGPDGKVFFLERLRGMAEFELSGDPRLVMQKLDPVVFAKNHDYTEARLLAEAPRAEAPRMPAGSVAHTDGVFTGKRIGVYAGTFDPPHAGHEHAILTALARGELDEVVVLVNPPGDSKVDASSWASRIRMAQAAFGEIPGVRFPSDRLLDEMGTAKYPDWIAALSEKNPKKTLFSIAGDDLLAEGVFKPMPQENVRYIFFSRDSASGNQGLRKQADALARGRYAILDNSHPDISSTRLRGELISGGKPEEISPRVAEIAREQGLYKNTPTPLARARYTDGVFEGTGRKIGVYAGTFDPPHEGHAAVIERMKKELGLEEIFVVVNAPKADKPNATAWALRREMAKAFLGKIEGVRFPSAAFEREMNEAGNARYAQWIQNLADKNPRSTLYSITGEDLLGDKFQTFRRENIRYVISGRGERELDELKAAADIPEIRGKVDVVLESGPSYSSTKAREQILAGLEPEGIAPEVAAIIRENRLYRRGEGRALASADRASATKVSDPEQWPELPRANYTRFAESLRDPASSLSAGSYTARFVRDDTRFNKQLDQVTVKNNAFAGLAARNKLSFTELRARVADCPGPATAPTCEEIFASFSEAYVKIDKRNVLEQKVGRLLTFPIRGNISEIGAGHELSSAVSRAPGGRSVISATHAPYATDASNLRYGRTANPADVDGYTDIARLEQQLKNEFATVPKGGDKLPFAVTNTMQTSRGNGRGWVGFKGQLPDGRLVEVKMHVQLLEGSSAHQKQTLAILQANLLDTVYSSYLRPDRFVNKLLDGLPLGAASISHIDMDAAGVGTNHLVHAMKGDNPPSRFLVFDAKKNAFLNADEVRGKLAERRQGSTFNLTDGRRLRVQTAEEFLAGKTARGDDLIGIVPEGPDGRAVLEKTLVAEKRGASNVAELDLGLSEMDKRVRELNGSRSVKMSISSVGDDFALSDRFFDQPMSPVFHSTHTTDEAALAARYGPEVSSRGPELLHQQMVTEFDSIINRRPQRKFGLVNQVDEDSGVGYLGLRAEAKPMSVPDDFLYRVKLEGLDPEAQKQVITDLSVNLAHAAFRDQEALGKLDSVALKERLLSGVAVDPAKVRLEKIELESLARLGRSDDTRVRFDVQLSAQEIKNAVRMAAADPGERARLIAQLDPSTRVAVAERVSARLERKLSQAEALAKASPDDLWFVPRAREDLFRAYREAYVRNEELVKGSGGQLKPVQEKLARYGIPLPEERHQQGYLEALKRFPGADKASVAGRRDVLRQHGWFDEQIERCLASGLCGDTFRARELAATDGPKPIARASGTRVGEEAPSLAKALGHVADMGGPEAAGKPVFGRILRGTRAEDFTTFTSDKIAGNQPRKLVFFMDEGGLSKAASRQGDELLREIGYTEEYISSLRAKKTEFQLVVFKPVGDEVLPATWDNVARLVKQEYRADIGEKVARALPELKTKKFSELDAEGKASMAKIYEAGEKDPRYVTAARLAAKKNPTAWDVRNFLYNEARLTELYTGTGKTLTPNGLDGVPEYIGVNRPLASLRHAEVLEVPATARASSTMVAQNTPEAAEARRLREIYQRSNSPFLADPARAAELKQELKALQEAETEYFKLLRGERGLPLLRNVQAIREHGEVLNRARSVFEGLGYGVEEVLLDQRLGAQIPRRGLRITTVPESDGIFSRSLALDAEARNLGGGSRHGLSFVYDPARSGAGSYFDDTNTIVGKRLPPAAADNVASYVVLHELKHAQVNRFAALRGTVGRDLSALENAGARAAAQLLKKEQYEVYQAKALFSTDLVLDGKPSTYGKGLDFDELAAIQKHTKVLEAQVRDAEFIRRHLGEDAVPGGLKRLLATPMLRASKEAYSAFSSRAEKAAALARARVIEGMRPGDFSFNESSSGKVTAVLKLFESRRPGILAQPDIILAVPLYSSKGARDPENLAHLRAYLDRAAELTSYHKRDAEVLASRETLERGVPRAFASRGLASESGSRASATLVAETKPAVVARDAELFAAHQIENAPAPLKAAALFRDKVERELSDLRRQALNGQISLHQFEERAKPYRRLDASVAAKVEGASYADLLADEEKLLARRLALAETELEAAKRAKNADLIARHGLEAARLRAEHAAVSARWIGEDLARAREIAASPAAAAEARRRTVLGFNEGFFAPFRKFFGGKSFQEVASDSAEAERLRSLAAKELVASRRAPLAARASLERAVGARFPDASAAEVRKRATDLADAVATGALRQKPAERGAAMKQALEAKGWTRDQMVDCGSLCLPGLPVTQARALAIEPSALAREVLLEDELVKARGPGQEQAKRVASPRSLFENQAEQKPYDVIRASLEEKQKALRAEQDILARRLDMAVRGREGRPDGSAPAATVEKLTQAHGEVKRALELVDTRIAVVKDESRALASPRALTPEELRLNDSAMAATMDYLRQGELARLREVDDSVGRVASRLRAGELNSFEAAQELRKVTAGIAPERNAAFVRQVKEFAAERPEFAALKAGSSTEEELATALRRTQRLQASTGHTDPELARAVYREAGLRPAEQALADAVGAAGEASAKGTRELKLEQAALKAKAEGELVKIAKADIAPAKASPEGKRQLASVKSPQESFEDALKGLDENTRKSVLESAQVVERGSDEVRLMALAQKFVAASADQRETMREVYKNMAEVMAKGEKRESALRYGVRKMLKDLGFSPSEINGAPAPGLYQRTIACFDL